MKTYQAVLCGAVFLCLPACIVPEDEGDPYPDWCEPGEQIEWEGAQVDHLALGYADLRNLVYWHTTASSHAAVVSTSGVPGSALDTALSGKGELVSSGSEYLYVWADEDRGQLLAHRIGADGAAIGDELIVGAVEGYPEQRAIFDGERYWILWWGDAVTDGRLQLAQVSVDGQLLGEPILVATGYNPSGDIAANGDGLWVVWRPWEEAPVAVRIARDGTVVDGESFSVLDDRTGAVHLAAKGDEVLLIGESIYGDQPPKVQRLGPDGPLSEPDAFGYHQDRWRNIDVAGVVADPDGDGYTMVAARYDNAPQFYCDDCSVDVFRLDANGYVIGDGPVASFPGVTPTVAFNGVHLLAAYVTHDYDASYDYGDRGRWQVETRPIYLDGTLGAAVELDAGEPVLIDPCE